ncbi:hypothetical protein AAFP30_04620 [Gordonia sp. CPCC 205515]|uniref:hypothetical protein n=1 Tax=Gordonia sp. CPCC 205515 TaxID=3140791 RepID=UPI003AF34261
MRHKMIRAAVLGTAVGAAAFAVPAGASAAPVSEANCAKISTPTSKNGWGNTFPDEQGQAGKYSATNVSDSDGSLEFTTTAQTPRNASYHTAGKLPLTELAKEPLTFEKKGGNANWQIRVTGANTGESSGFTTLVWTAPQDGKQPDATKSNQWWATRDLPGVPQGTNASLDKLVAAANSSGHTTVIDDYGISSQPNEKSGKVNVDNVSFNGCTTNFAAKGGSGGNGSVELPSFS